MNKIFILGVSLFIVGCTETPEAPIQKEHLAKDAIEKNKSEAQQAQTEYLKLKKQRARE